MSQLVHACRTGNLELVTALLESGHDPNYMDKDGWTPLLSTILHNHPEILSKLLDTGVDSNHVDQDGWTPLFYAIHCGHPKIIDRLLTQHINLNHLSSEGYSALYMASYYGRDDVIRSLLQLGANPNGDMGGKTPFFIACERGHWKCAWCLLDAHADYNQPDAGGKPPLYVACQKGYVDLVRWLLDHNVNPNQPTHTGDTALNVVCRWGHVQMISLLLLHGADPNPPPNQSGFTPIMYCAHYNYPKMIETMKMMIAYGAIVPDNLSLPHDFLSMYLTQSGIPIWLRGLQEENSPVQMLLGFPEICRYIVAKSLPSNLTLQTDPELP